MSERIGKMLTCDRCGSFVFLNYTGKQEFDGGFTQVETFEDPPKGWDYGNAPLGIDALSAHDAMLCPDCRKEYIRIIKNFYDKDTVAKSIQERNTVYEPRR